ncbi:sperm acrosome-associated protein 9 [Tiliqua scincoides]|uniref:sperm acrosome-associated protein 9 n=1 Tax=Tiliqua scincoides TaxID=71010 RepID=UPI0034635FD6
MNEIKENLRSIEQTYKIFQQQQFTFIAALEHTRENAHDKIKPVSSIGQVQTYTDHYCNNTTDKRILLMFLNICCELNKLCLRLEALHPGNNVTNAILDRCKTLVSHSNDLSGLRAKYPHDVVNHLSCDEARNHYGGVVSLIPVVLDCVKEWVAHTEKLPRNMLQASVSGEKAAVFPEKPTGSQVTAGTGSVTLRQPAFHTAATQTSLTLPDKTQALERSRGQKLQLSVLGRTPPKILNGPWRPPGRHNY